MNTDAIALGRPFSVTLPAIVAAGLHDYEVHARGAGTPEIGATAILAHDLRGPLTNLALLLEAIAAATAASSLERIARLAARAQAIADRMECMLSGLLERTRQSGDPLAVRLAAADLASIIDTVVTQNQCLAERCGVTLHVSVAEPAPLAGDGELITQAIDNLVVNAIRFTRPGGTVRCEAGPADGGYVVDIIDQGPGFTEADIARAFRPFTRLSARTDAPGASTGLGLWIVRLIAEAHGGRIEVQNNRDGHGAILSLRLPGGTDARPKLAS